MGASALVSALNALPWDEESEGSSSSSDEDEGVPQRGQGPARTVSRSSRPKGELKPSSRGYKSIKFLLI